jgi:predicted lipoprotein with Yx(FWY)xxD motif
MGHAKVQTAPWQTCRGVARHNVARCVCRSDNRRMGREIVAAALLGTFVFGACGTAPAKGGSRAPIAPASHVTSLPLTRTTSATVVATSAGTFSVRVTTVVGKGPILVDGYGYTLYHFDSDAHGAIACTGPCSTTWPPEGSSMCGCLIPGHQGTHVGPIAGPGVSQAELGSLTRPDGSSQLTFNGLALYRYSGDQAAGDARGDGVSGLWHVVRPPSGSAGGRPSG